MRLVLGAVLLGAAPAWAAPDAPASVPTVAAATPADLPPVICTAPGGEVHLVVTQPDQSTFAAGPGECWLTVNGTHPDSPVRIYMTFEAPGKRLGATLDDTAEDAIRWANDHRLFRGKVEAVDTGRVALGDVAAPFHRLRGLPEGGETTREALFTHVVAAGMDVVLVAHWDAFHPDGLGDEAMIALRRMSLHTGERPSLAATPPPDEAAPAGAAGPVPTSIEKTPTPAALGEVPDRSVEETKATPPAPAAPPEETKAPPAE